MFSHCFRKLPGRFHISRIIPWAGTAVDAYFGARLIAVYTSITCELSHLGAGAQWKTQQQLFLEKHKR